jgi:hypothetical protein
MTPARPASALATPASKRPMLELVKPKPLPVSNAAVRSSFWALGIILASFQAWNSRYEVTADSISYFDMSDGVLRGADWHRLINGMYSGLYPLLLGIFRRLFNISPGNEIAASHVLGVVLFLFAFACFEFLLVGALRRLEPADGILDEDRASVPLPQWAFLSIAYSVFLWSCLTHIQLEVPRADMLLSGFFFLAIGSVLRMDGRAARWGNYLALGSILGIGILAKEAMLPIGILTLASTLFLVENWRPAVKMAAGALAVMLMIGSLYFVPLSLKQGRLTLGDAGTCVYLTNVDMVSPHWYLQSTGSAKGSFLHPPKKMFSEPPAYAFAIPTIVTQPLRFDQSYWMEGIRPHFVWWRQMATLKVNLRAFAKLFLELRFVLGSILVIVLLSGGRKQILGALVRAWPAWLIGTAGCLMYAAVWVEPRYVTAFLTLCCVGLLVGLPIPATRRKLAHLVVILIVAASVAVLMFSVAAGVYRARRHHTNVELEAARSLQNLGLMAGDPVARISRSSADLVVERILRVEIVAEVDYNHAPDFWTSPLTTQHALLQAFAAQGVKAVIATSPALNAENQSEWSRLGSTQYWVWRPAKG